MKAPDELWTVARSLADLRDAVVFVGGMIRELLITDVAAGPARPTEDVDCVIDVGTFAEYVHVTERLRALGFREDTDEDAPLCRWIVRNIRVDPMPIDPNILGFTNVWYASGFEHAIRVEGDGATIRIFDAPHFCATKIEAYLGRGGGDLSHHDIEDFIAIVDARPTIVSEITNAPRDVRNFLARMAVEWLADARFLDAIPWHLMPDAASQARLPFVLERLRAIAGLGDRTSTPPRSQAALTSGLPQTRAAIAGPNMWRAHSAGASLPGRAVLQSTNIREVAYDAETLTLTVEFRNGRVYLYQSVPPNLYAGLLRAASQGRYFNQWIKDRFTFRRLR